ncbi:ACT domain-containing protein [Pseudoalteromonas luteoviolacea]|uniref:ACT domain-containing protein n=1 Tax=Pseudoalteromonas luteoviolacea TaxID=43657 RepID=UPI000B1D2AFC|nr:ACT domain-containing protein [Pseudoalteromonas luteoviolacea]
MTGETNLAVLIASMEPELLAETYVYAVVDESKFESLPINAITGFFREREGITVIVQQQHANTLGLAYEGEYRCITLNVHSSLQAVGLTAAFSNALVMKTSAQMWSQAFITTTYLCRAVMVIKRSLV